MQIEQIKMTLNGVFSAQIAYCEGDKTHPFLEEVIALYSYLFETLGDIRSALYMWQTMLVI